MDDAEPYLPATDMPRFIRDMMEFVELTERDVVAIRSSAPVVLRHAEALTAALYEKFLALPRSPRFFLREDGTVDTQEEAGRAWQGEKLLVERGGEGLGVPEHDGCRAPDRDDVPLGQLDELHHVADEPRHVGGREIRLRVVHAGSMVPRDHSVKSSCEVSPRCRGGTSGNTRSSA